MEKPHLKVQHTSIDGTKYVYSTNYRGFHTALQPGESMEVAHDQCIEFAQTVIAMGYGDQFKKGSK